MSDQAPLFFTLANKAQKKVIKARQKKQKAKKSRSNKVASSRRQTTTPKLSAKQKSGYCAEARARQHVELSGLIVLHQNLQCASGEIDLVCRDQQQLVFIEVRQRQKDRYGGAAASITRRKQQRVIKAAAYYLPWLTQAYFDQQLPRCRFDVIVFEGEQLNWFKNAFNAE